MAEAKSPSEVAKPPTSPHKDIGDVFKNLFPRKKSATSVNIDGKYSHN